MKHDTTVRVNVNDKRPILSATMDGDTVEVKIVGTGAQVAKLFAAMFEGTAKALEMSDISLAAMAVSITREAKKDKDYKATKIVVTEER